ncbi:MAG: helix-hairpin-helix domain-containing protein [Thermoplasmata archaeon]
MSRSTELAGLFDTVADLLELRGEVRFKPAAYRRAARSLESLGEAIERVSDRGALASIPGVGPAIAEKIREFLRTGTIAYYEGLKSQFPPGVLELLSVPGIGPKTARRLLLELQIESPEALRAAIETGRLDGRAGFGPKRIGALRAALVGRSAGSGEATRTPLLVAWELAERILAELRARVSVEYLGAAGSLRRGRETIGDIDLLAATSEPAPVFEAFSALPGVREVRLRGETKETVIFEPGVQIDLRVVPPESVGAALQYFTGSKEHNIRIRALAREQGLKVNEYGVYRGEEALPARSEEAIYQVLGLPWIPPEIRENRGEIEAARAGRIPTLVAPEDLCGDLHLHLPAGGAGAPARWAEAARRSGLEELGRVVEGAAGIPVGRPAREGAGAARAGSIRWKLGIEIAPEEIRTALPEGIEYRILRAGPGAPPEPRLPDRSVPPILFLAHLPPPGDPHRDGWIRWARTEGIGLEVTPDPGGEGLDSGEVRQTVEAGGPLYLSSRAGQPGELGRLALAVRTARRGWAGAGGVANARAAAGPEPAPSTARRPVR